MARWWRRLTRVGRGLVWLFGIVTALSTVLGIISFLASYIEPLDKWLHQVVPQLVTLVSVPLPVWLSVVLIGIVGLLVVYLTTPRALRPEARQRLAELGTTLTGQMREFHQRAYELAGYGVDTAKKTSDSTMRSRADDAWTAMRRSYEMIRPLLDGEPLELTERAYWVLRDVHQFCVSAEQLGDFSLLRRALELLEGDAERAVDNLEDSLRRELRE